MTTTKAITSAMNRSPITATSGDAMPRRDPVEAHAAEVDGEQRGDEGPDPAAVERRPRLLLVCDAVGDRDQFGLVRQAELREDGLARVARREHRRRDDVPRRAADAQSGDDCERPASAACGPNTRMPMATARLPSAGSTQSVVRPT